MTACYQSSCNKLHTENALSAVDEIRNELNESLRKAPVNRSRQKGCRKENIGSGLEVTYSSGQATKRCPGLTTGKIRRPRNMQMSHINQHARSTELAGLPLQVPVKVFMGTQQQQ